MSGRVQGRVASGVGRAAVLVVVVTAALAGVPRAGAAEGAEPGVAGPAPEAPAPAEAPGDPTRGGWDGFLDPLRDAEARVTAAQARVERRQVHVGFGLVAQLALSRRPEALLPVEYRHDESDAKVFTSGRIRVHSGQDVVGFPFTYRFP